MAALTPPGHSGAPSSPLPDALALPAAAALVAAGGTVGVLIRALLAQSSAPAAGAWPWTTFGINVVGSLLLGGLLAVLQRGPDVGRRRVVRLGLGTGVLGGFTTYSTFALEVEQLVADGHAVVGAAYAAASVVLGIAAAGAAIVTVGHVLDRRPARTAVDDAPGDGS
ncbi:CrcB family protein [Cellulomonas phragmiteti]|uniref:Fluoride-specific ion channel FluC n=1 Tax=Cellulomonas phragmiteti TaxID=478780 RepID=A0ABQ4DQ49_9CELL|nr:CrcB family protein [Cellulomonas phragmiteti]GIG41470.1 hypothetical protein Cph01nite_32320 [Cellulomonas phragmiteti]